ncbi:2-nitropropane dioxygenase [Advenella faeciporci]|uniref:2-nitropropane dioxygenase n=1 Tax=Advenella faeciporci TaxID=797535 RepID=A0A918MY23_9BURK|nr:nitronate monooxygenase family protein [Advenella faeciporci]GGW83383.1 2-nitropropane dioxygenase [Advenella faeciporci]
MKTFTPFESLRLPVFAAPMFLVSGVDLVVAACKSGIVGCFPTTNARPLEQLDSWMAQISNALREFKHEHPDLPVGPWCANVITHSSNTRLPGDLALLEKYQPPIVVTALGSPKPVIEIVHSYGGIVIADVINLKLAMKAADAGADGLACISSGAGGHTGFLSPFAFVSAIKQFFNGYIIIGGGITNGQGVAGSLAAGADFVYMGTRFIPTVESMASDAYKEMIVRSTIDDLVVSDRITGTPASWLKPSLEQNGLDLTTLDTAPSRNYDSSQQIDTRRWKSIWAAGQGLGSIHHIEPVSDVVDRLEQEFHQACDEMINKTAMFLPPCVQA